jgi:hypothetical protein
MHRLIKIFVIGMAIVFPGSAVAQTAQDLVGTWLPVSAVNTRPDGSTIDTFGPNPKGILVFQSDGHFAFILNRVDLPRLQAIIAILEPRRKIRQLFREALHTSAPTRWLTRP